MDPNLESDLLRTFVAIAEMLEGRREQFVAELRLQGVAARAAEKEVDAEKGAEVNS